MGLFERETFTFQITEGMIFQTHFAHTTRALYDFTKRTFCKAAELRRPQAFFSPLPHPSPQNRTWEITYTLLFVLSITRQPARPPHGAVSLERRSSAWTTRRVRRGYGGPAGPLVVLRRAALVFGRGGGRGTCPCFQRLRRRGRFFCCGR